MPHYIDNKQLETLILAYVANPSNEAANVLATHFTLIAKKLRHSFNLDEDEAIQDALIKSFESLPNFNPAKGKAFSFITMVITNQFRWMRRVRKHYAKLKLRYARHLLSMASTSERFNESGVALVEARITLEPRK